MAGAPASLTRRAVQAAVAVAGEHGVAWREPVIIRDHTNVLVHLAPAPVLARVSTATALVPTAAARLEREVAVAAHLVAAGAPVAAPSAELPPGPHEHEGLFLTFWTFYDHDPSRPLDGRAAGEGLRAIHAALADYAGRLPGFDPLDEIGELLDVLDRSLGLETSDLAVLQEARADLSRELASLDLSSRPLHGDAHLGNVLRTPAGPLWTDLEEACTGPVEWDVACLVTTAMVFGPDPDVEAALAGYGEYNGARLPLLVDLRALFTAAWSALLSERFPENRPAAERRLRWWRERYGA